MKADIISTTEAQQICTKALSSLSTGNQLLTKSYLAELGKFDIQPVKDVFNTRSDVRIFHLSRLILENRQSVLESATAAYTALGTAGYSVFFLLKSDGKSTSLYLGVRGEANSGLGRNAGELLEQVMNGHFSGSLLTNQNGDKVEELLRTLEHNARSVTAITGVPSLSIEDKDHFVQGLEHFIDASEGKTYQVLILAQPVLPKQLEYIRTGYEQVATQLSPLLKQSLSFGQNESESVGLSLSHSLSESLGTSLGLTETKGTSTTDTKTATHGTSETRTEGESTSQSTQTNLSKTASIVAPLVGSGLGLMFSPVGAMIGGALGGMLSTALSKSESKTQNTSQSYGSTRSDSYSTASGRNESLSTAHTESQTTTSGLTSGQTNTKIQVLAAK